MILNGWKEIAHHLGRGVRTVQRWEYLGLPIRRPKRKDRSAVCAFSEEIDEWLRRVPRSEKSEVAQAPTGKSRGIFSAPTCPHCGHELTYLIGSTDAATDVVPSVLRENHKRVRTTERSDPGSNSDRQWQTQKITEVRE